MLLVACSVCLIFLAILAQMPLAALRLFRKGRGRHQLGWPKKLSYSGWLFLVIGLVGYGISIVHRSVLFHASLKHSARWTPQAIQFDAELGHALVPNYRGVMTRPIGPSVVSRHDENGFRVPAEPTPINASGGRPLLTLGCSCTYGYGCLAEEAYPYLVGAQLKTKTVNAGVSGYGLAQMLLVARKLIPRYQPAYVLVQYSPWLLDRAVTPNSLYLTARQPSPFLYEAPGGNLAVHPPAFPAISYDLGLNAYAPGVASVWDYLRFQGRIGLPLYLHDDWNMVLYHAKTAVGVLPRPAMRNRLAERVYREIADLCEAAHSQMVIVVFGFHYGDITVPESFSSLPALVVRADSALSSRLSEQSDECYAREYHHWHGSPPVKIDHHPNPPAHSIMADAIVEAIKQSQPGH
jgi:hypothetical protein